MELKEAISKITTELKNDAGYRESWKTNIAMAYKDCEHRYMKKTGKKQLNKDDKHIIANDAAEFFLKLFCSETKQKCGEYGDFLAYNSNTIGIEKIFLIQENIEPILLFVNYKSIQGDWISPRKILRKLVKDNLQLFTENGRIELHSFKFRSRSDIESFNNIMLNKATPDVVNVIVQLKGKT